jgi:hypothetical protein
MWFVSLVSGFWGKVLPNFYLYVGLYIFFNVQNFHNYFFEKKRKEGF